MKVSLEDILDNIRDSLTGEELRRIHLVTRKVTLNYSRPYNLNKESILHSGDYVIINAWVKHLQNSSNIIHFYKAQLTLYKEHPKLKVEDFCLITANAAQIE